MNLIFATHNQHKSEEIQKILQGQFIIRALSDIGFTDDIPETGSTLEENAIIKARFVHKKFNQNCFADDSGLEVEALNGAPGVFSARYAGEPRSDEKNIEKLLLSLEKSKNKKARFRTVIALILDGKEYLFDGIVNGKITTEIRGSNGFGYDPVFIPDGYEKTFAEMIFAEKNKTSHRSIAVKKLASFLSTLK